MINIFKKKTIFKFKTTKTLSSIVHDQRIHFNEAAVRYVAKHAKKQFRWVRKDDYGEEYYHYYLDEKHITYMDLAWPEFTNNWRYAPDKFYEMSRRNPLMTHLVRQVNLDIKELVNVQPMTGVGLFNYTKSRYSKGKK